MKNKLTNLFIALCLSLFLAGCDDEDTPQPVAINFTNQEVGISSSSPSTEVGITFSRAVSSAGEIELTISSGNLTYGSDADFYTDPEAAGNTITIAYAVGDESANFTVSAGSALNIQNDENVTISLVDSNSDLVVGQNSTVTVTFSENYIAPAGTIELNAGGATFSNQSYVDLSKLQQTTLDKYNWDLGFSTAAGEHSVVLNSPAFTMARLIDKDDLNAVTAEDTVDFGYEMSIPPPNFDASIGSFAWVDSPDGNLETTAIGAISATASENKVFIIKRDGDRNWKKIRVLQNEDNYTLQYADIAATTFETLEITKKEDFNFIFVDLDNGETEVEPAKDSWDIMYGSYTETLPLGPGMFIPYGYLDFITINRNNTEVGMVMIEDITYDDFSSDDIGSVEFSSAVDAIGENWRQGGGPGMGPSLHEDRFFVLKDSEGTFFKIKFTRLTSTDGERGYPEFTFDRVH